MMPRQHNNRIKPVAALALLAFMCLGLATNVQGEKSPPNIVLVFVDDLGYADLGSYGLESAKTPHLDRLASEGMRFTSFYAQHLCGPSRLSLLTGRYPSRVDDGRWTMPPEEVTFAELLHGQGYATACIGKWDASGREAIHERMPNAQGFDHYWGTLGSNDEAKIDLYENTNLIGEEEEMAVLSRVYTDHAIKWMRTHVDSNGPQPFMLYLSHSMMHTVIDASKPFRDRTGNGLYADTLEELDHECGRLLKAIDEIRIRDNTLVIFTSDNGPWSNDQPRQLARHERHGTWGTSPKVLWGDAAPLREGKGSDYEGGVRVPCLIRWPGKVPVGQESDAIFATLDFLPTFASLAGADLPKDRVIDGVDQTDLLMGKTKVGNRKTYFYFSGKHGVREGKWKLLYPDRWPAKFKRSYPKDRGSNELELYNLELDLGETTNLAKKRPDIVEHLLSLKIPVKP